MTTTTSHNHDEDITTTSSTNEAFDGKIKLLQRDNAARCSWTTRTSSIHGEDVQDYDYFQKEMANRLIDRLADVRGEFPLALEIGAGPGIFFNNLLKQHYEEEEDDDDDDETIHSSSGTCIGGIRKLVQMDASHGMLYRDENYNHNKNKKNPNKPLACETFRMVHTPLLVQDDDNDKEKKTSKLMLPFPNGTFDLVLSMNALHWINDLPTLFTEIHRVLKPNGCFLFSMVGGESLPELRASLVLAELEREGGVSPHVGPFCSASDIGSMLGQANFTLPTVDVDTIRLSYPSSMVLMEHLQRMGESNACLHRRRYVSRDTFLASACLHEQLFGIHNDDENELADVEASVQVIYSIAWTPHESQPKPLQRGSATSSFKNITVDRTKGNK